MDELSGGKLAYVWLPNTGDGGFNYFNRYYFAQKDKKGIIVDERDNHGGLIADYITDLLKDKFTYGVLSNEIEALARKIRRSVYYDSLKMYSNTEFETNIKSTIGNVKDAGAFIPGLESFIVQRISAVKKELKINEQRK